MNEFLDALCGPQNDAPKRKKRKPRKKREPRELPSWTRQPGDKATINQWWRGREEYGRWETNEVPVLVLDVQSGELSFEWGRSTRPEPKLEVEP